MYEVKEYIIPDEYTYSEYVNELLIDIKTGNNTEECKDILFRLTYPLALQELKKYTNMDELEELLPDMSVAFMLSIGYYNPDKAKCSFVNYYKLAIKDQIIRTHYKHRQVPGMKELYRDYQKDRPSLDMPIAISDEDTATMGDMIEDTTVNIEDEVIGKDIEDKIHEVIDTLFVHDYTKDIFLDYIDGHMAESPIPLQILADKYDVSIQYISSLIQRYKPRLRKALKRRGY